MELKLKVLDGKHAGQEVPVPGTKFFIGRAEDCQLRPGSDMISRHHCVLVVEPGYAGVRDLGSKNGTYVNAERVQGERELKAGDLLKVGPLEFEVTLNTGVGGKKKPAVTGGIKEAAARAATNDSSASDIDVSEWLEPEAGEPVAKGPHETQKFGAASQDTSEIDMGSTRELALPEGLAAAADAETKEAEEAAKVDPKAKKTPGKLPFQPPRVAAKDSRDAAAKVLEMMKKRR